MDLNQVIAMIKQGVASPQQITLQLLETRMKGTPMGDNLIQLARSGRTDEIEKIARNLATQQGVDFDKELEAFRRSLGF